MSDHMLTRRRAMKTAAAVLASGLSGCGWKGCGGKATPESQPQGAPMFTPTPPALGWETIGTGSGGPGPRSRHGLVYDRGANAAVLFGGIVWHDESLRDDTWEFRDRRWHRVTTPVHPPARHRGGMVYLAHREQAVLFGGQDDRNKMLADVWAYADRRWHQLRPRGDSPSARAGHSMAYDEHSQQLVLFGGITPGDEPLGDTWVFDGTRWQRVGGPAPRARRYAAFAYHPQLKGCLLHGGSDDDNGRLMYGDAWLFKDGVWERLADGFDTDPRDDHGLAFHRRAERMVMLEGTRAVRGVLADRPDGWERLDPNPLHPRHQCSPLVWHDALGGLLMYGGETGHGGSQFGATLLLHLPPANPTK